MTHKNVMYWSLTIGSQWVDGKVLPAGGKFVFIVTPYEYEDGENQYDAAHTQLDEYMKENHPGKSFHIHYWELGSMY